MNRTLKTTKQLKEEADKLEQEARIAEANKRIRDANYIPPTYPPYYPYLVPYEPQQPDYIWQYGTKGNAGNFIQSTG